MEPDLYDLVSAWLGREIESARCEELIAAAPGRGVPPRVR